MVTPLQTVNTDGYPPASSTALRVLGVEYLHLRLPDGADLYVTRWGMPFLWQLLPQNHWGDREWFTEHREKLPGTSSIYRARTKEVEGVSKDIVLKWNRMGQDVPGETEASELANAQFNSPFEEFGLVMEMRDQPQNSQRLFTHKPLAIFVPRHFVEPERLRRRTWRFEQLQQEHREVTLDPNRNYAVIYEWIKGLDAIQAMHRGLITKKAVARLLARSNADLRRAGFRINDNKAHHLIVRPNPNRGLARYSDNNVLYALVDFELLERTPDHEREVRAWRRRSYLSRQPERFERHRLFPPALFPVRIMDVDYVYGRVESSSGALWVVGEDPALFDYFLPEKWRKTPRESLSPSRRTFKTITKDDIHLVWRVSRVGETPEVNPASGEGSSRTPPSYNCPFHEFALALQLQTKGVETTYPRAIYMTSHKSGEHTQPEDETRYKTHEHLLCPDGHPILSTEHRYIILWGYWNGPDELLAAHDRHYYRPVDAQKAFNTGLITAEEQNKLMSGMQEQLREAGMEAPYLKPDHLLLSMYAEGCLVTNDKGLPRARLCSFDLLRRAR